MTAVGPWPADCQRCGGRRLVDGGERVSVSVADLVPTAPASSLATVARYRRAYQSDEHPVGLILIDSSNRIINGHHRRQALLELGTREVEVWRLR